MLKVQCLTSSPDLSTIQFSGRSSLGCAVIFASKRNEAKRKRNCFRFDAKKRAFFACFASMRNLEIWSETKMERNKNKTKKKRKTAIIFAPKRNEAKRKRKTAILVASKQMSETEAKNCQHFRFEAKWKQNFFRFKGTVARDFWPLVFSTNRPHIVPEFTP